MAEYSVMDRINMIISDPDHATMTLAQIVTEEIREFKASEQYANMIQAEAYYRNRTDVQRKTNDVANRSNTRIEHPILKKLVDQKANYLLGKPFTVDTKNSSYMDLSSDCDSLATELKDTFQRLKLFIDVYLQIAGKGDFSKETFDIVFNMDLPVNETDVIQNAVASESLLSKRTILQNHPWVTDADEEMERIDAEKKAAMEEYGEGLFGDALGAGKGQNGQGDPVNGGGADGNE